MKLLIYSHFFAPSTGGVETIVLSLARGLSELRDAAGAREFEITLVTQTPTGNCDDSKLPFRVVRRPGALGLWRLIRSSDIVHVAGPALAPVILGQLARRLIVVEHHGFQTICPNGQLFIEPHGVPCPGHFMAERHGECLRCNSGQGWFFSWKLWLLTFVRRFLSAQVAANITPTEWLAGLLELPRSTAIHHGLGLAQTVSRNPAPSGIVVFVFMGRLVTTKGTHLLLRAAKILQGQNRRFELLIIGEGPERAALEQFVSDNQLEAHVRFAGRLDDSELDAAFGLASAVVVPSLGGEVFGLVVTENMLRALPVVASDIGAFLEVLGGAGLTFRTGDAADLARALSLILDDPSLAVSLGQRARRRALDFSQSRMIEAHARLYQSVSQ